MRTGLGLSLLLLLAACKVHAIYEEQAGENDWHAEFIGQATSTHIVGKDRLAVATKPNVVALLSTTTGTIIWRQVLHNSDQLQEIAVLSKPAVVLSLSSSGTMLRAWQISDGALLWEQRLTATTAPAAPAALSVVAEASSSVSQVVITNAEGVQAFSGVTGIPLWQRKSAQGWVQVSKAALTSALTSEANANAITIAGTLDSGNLEILSLDASSGAEVARTQLAAPRSTAVAGPVIVRAGLVAAVTADGHSLCSARLAGDDSLHCQAWSAISPAAAGSAVGSLLPLESDSRIAVKLDTGVLVIHVVSGGVHHAVFSKGATAISNEISKASGKLLAAVHSVADGGLSIHTFPVTTASTGHYTIVPKLGLVTKDGAAVPVTDVFLANVANAADPLVGVSAADGTFLAVQGKWTAWRREEALAGVSAALFVDLPGSAESAAQADPGRRHVSFSDQIQAQLLSLKGQLSVIQPDEKLELAKLKAAMSGRLTPTRDSNGFRKLLVVATQHGKLFGLHSGDGHVMWSQSHAIAAAPQQIFPWRSQHDVQHAPELLALHSSSKQASFSIINAHTGAELSSGALTNPVSQVLELPQSMEDEVAEQHVYLLIGGTAGALQASLLPDSSQSRSFLASLPNQIFFWQEDRQTGTLHGYHVDKQSLRVSQLWTNVYSGPGTGLLEVAARNPAEHVHSPAKILGNKSLKIKYLSPSTVFVATGPPQGTLTEDLDPSSIALTVHIVDTVTGAPVFSQIHKGCRGPVHARFVENWVTYHYWDVSNHRWEMSVLELYNKAQGNVTITDMVLGRSNSTTSSFEPVPLEVLRQSYFFDAGVKSISVSNTMHGISNKILLVGTLSDQVYMLEKKFLDPRRPLGKPSKDDQEEGLIPYQPSLPISPLLYATHSKQVTRLSGIVTAPANLESTSLMLAYGLDLFFSRLQPNKAFDSLQDDFPYAFLVLITLILLGACLVLKRLDDRASVKRKWQ